MNERRIHLTWVAMALLVAPAWAGVVFEVETKDYDGHVETRTGSVEGQNLKMEVRPGSPGANNRHVIFRGDRREMVVVDHETRTYLMLDPATVAHLAVQVSRAQDEVARALEGVPEAQRAAVEEMTKQRLPPTEVLPSGELRRTGHEAEQNGYPCVEYEVWRQGKKTRELWVTDWDHLAELAGAFRGAASLVTELMDTLATIPGFGIDSLSDSFLTQIEEVDGFPVVIRDLNEEGVESESSFRGSRRQTIDPAEFEPPAGYKRQSLGAP